ncbi:MAG: mannose-1-phosphate guanylyltransferase [Deltaproteobacteria bacterium]|nr:mannose-1-phosphate guanylyltransferase [Deltaproteobacteria bacterium]
MFAVIMAGGSGNRFWPISRAKNPKQLLKIIGEECMLVETCNRLNPLIKDEEIIVIIGSIHRQETEKVLLNRNVHLIAEPVGKNTAPCIGLGALIALQMGCDKPVAFLPADHFIANPSSFLDALKTASTVAESGGIVLLGIIPTRPETGYGYIKKSVSGSELGGHKVYQVDAFVEKPDQTKALQYLANEDYYWNAGIFVATPGTIMAEIKKNIPDLYEGLESLKKSLGTDSFENEMERVYGELQPVSFDYGIMEKTHSPLYIVPCECGWSDVGSWNSLYELRKKESDRSGNLADGNVLLIDCSNSFISENSKRLVTCLGIDKCLVIDTPDALLIADIDRSQDIRKIVDILRKNNKTELL